MEAVNRGQVTLEDKITISERAASMGGSQMYMEPGEQHSLEELMFGIAMVSANDACVAVAEHVAGSVEIFVEKMNQRAAELGMENTNFVNTNGLPVANHYSSAYDIAVMSRELMKFPICKEWFTTWQHSIKVGLPGRETEFGLTNTNRLIRQYTGADGIKTGFTQDAGYCLAGSATRGEMTLIAVILGSPSSQVRFHEVGEMLDYGFAAYDTVKIAEKGEPTGILRIEKGSPEILNAVAGEDIFILVKKGEQDGITTGLALNPKVKAPLEKGQKLGDVIIFENGKEIEKYPLVAEEKVEKASFSQLYIRMMKNLII
jgi:D-alanyl-D-alanine carboxypeptidase (penicillin-binding protein 5/6)